MKVGLVFSGGGGKGAYEIGVWKALEEIGITKYIKSVSGSSIGAINAALFAQGDINLSMEMWKEVTLSKIVPISNAELIKKGVALAIGGKNMKIVKKYLSGSIQHGDVPRDGAMDIINKYIKLEKIRENGINVYVCCTEMPNFNAEYFNINIYEDSIARSIFIATASLPMIYESQEIVGKNYLDGGLADNTPIKPLYDDGCDIIIAVLLSREARIDRNQFPGARILEIVPSEIETKVMEGLLNLDEDAKLRRIENGYNDTMNIIMPVFEIVREIVAEEQQSKINGADHEKSKVLSLWQKIKRKIK